MEKIKELEGMLTGLSNQMEEWFNYFKVGLSSLAWRMNYMEESIQIMRDVGTAQCSTSDSLNLGRLVPNDRVAENNQGSSDKGTMPMDTEEDPPNPLQNPEVQDTNSNMS